MYYLVITLPLGTIASTVLVADCEKKRREAVGYKKETLPTS